jgi:hypothetical protein
VLERRLPYRKGKALLKKGRVQDIEKLHRWLQKQLDVEWVLKETDEHDNTLLYGALFYKVSAKAAVAITAITGPSDRTGVGESPSLLSAQADDYLNLDSNPNWTN